MQSPEQQIRQLLADAERKQADVRARAAMLLAEADMLAVTVAAYKNAMKAFENTDDAKHTETSIEAYVVKAKRPSTNSGSMPGGAKWVTIFARLVLDHASPYGYPEITQAALDSGHQIELSSLRTQMWNAANAGLFEREGPGKFVLTEMGRKMIKRPFENESPTGGSEAKAGEVLTLPGFLSPNPVRVGQ